MHQTAFRIVSESKYTEIQFSPESGKFDTNLSVYRCHIKTNRSQRDNVTRFGYQYVFPRSGWHPSAHNRWGSFERKVFRYEIVLSMKLTFRFSLSFSVHFRVRTLSRQSVVSESVDGIEPDSCCSSQNKCKCVKSHHDRNATRASGKYTKNDSTDSDKDECNKWQYLPNTVWKQTAEVTKNT